MVNKLLENQFQTMFIKFDDDKLEALTLQQFQKFTYAIGMDFINQHYNSGLGELFETPENPQKSRVTFVEFMMYLNKEASFDYSDQQYRQAMEILDQEGEGQEAQIEDIKRVLSTYSKMSG